MARIRKQTTHRIDKNIKISIQKTATSSFLSAILQHTDTSANFHSPTKGRRQLWRSTECDSHTFRADLTRYRKKVNKQHFLTKLSRQCHVSGLAHHSGNR